MEISQCYPQKVSVIPKFSLKDAAMHTIQNVASSTELASKTENKFYLIYITLIYLSLKLEP